MAGNRDAFKKSSQVEIEVQETTSSQRSGLPRWSFHQNRSFFWMILSFLSGVALSVSHHLFYAMFDGLQVDQVPISQTWIIRTGTVFAFVIKTLLVVAVSIAFVQQQWVALSNHHFKIRQIDTMTGVLGNAFSFLESRIWLRFPLLTLLAGVAWLLPIAAIITPAAINVVTREKILNTQGEPPQLHFVPKYYASLQNMKYTPEYVGPSPEILRIAFGSAITGQMRGIPQESSNMTYTLEFFGPALRCDPADAALISAVNNSYMKDIGPNGYIYNYMAWVPEAGIDRGNISANSKSTSLDIISTDAAHIYVIPNTTMLGPYFAGREMMTFLDRYGYDDLLDCTLHNASYRAFFNLTFANQAIEVQARELLNPVNIPKDIEYSMEQYHDGTLGHTTQRICYQSIMDSFGRLLVGREMKRDGTIFTTGSWNMVPIEWTTRNGTQKGLEQLFQNITLSMLSVPSLIMNSTVAAKNRVPVDIHTNVNIYTYDPHGLLLAYSIACGAALLGTILGVHGIWHNGGMGYQSVFSTFVRTTRDHVFKEMIEPNDRGTEPLPKKLAEASIVLDT